MAGGRRATATGAKVAAAAGALPSSAAVCVAGRRSCGERATLEAAARLGGTAGCARAWACWLTAAARATAAARLDERAAACARRLALEMALLRLGRHTLARTARRRVDLRAATSLCGGAVKRWRARADRARDDVAAVLADALGGGRAREPERPRAAEARLAAAGWAPAMEVWV